MPSTFDQLTDPPRKSKTIKSAFDSESFDADGTIHVDGLVGSATISPSGRDVALASPEGLAIIDLDSPYSPPRRLSSHGLPWLVVDAQWSPFAVRDYWVASTANHRCLVWNLNLRDDSSSGAIEHSLQGHSRAITDINFSAHHPDTLATCSVDGYVHCWDLRRPRQPALTFCDWFAGATQVKYNRQDPHILASSHDRWLHIWDDRNPCKPLKSISAHTSKIYGVDWNRFRSTGIVTCSLDKSIKFWDYEADNDMPERVIRTDFPVWRARHTPFGWGILAMPQNEPGNLYMYDRQWGPDTPVDGAMDPVTVFPGHGDGHKVKEFLWRSRGGISEDGIDNREFQLVSWGEDNDLRLQTVDPSSFAAVGYVKGAPATRTTKLTRKGATYKTFRTVDDGVPHERRNPTMSDARMGGSSTQYRRSALTMGMQAPNYKANSTWKGPSMKAKTAGGKGLDRSQAHIGWMRGISINKRKTTSDVPQRMASKDSTMFSPGYHDGVWGEPETIQEEFIRISNQLQNVEWENIDMDNLSLNASLKGPWGADGDTIFIKVKVDIPAAYPKIRAPKFVIEKTSFMPEQTRRKIEREIHELASRFLQRKQNCLDVVFFYLLGEVSLESSTTFCKNVGDIDDGIGVLADESSSDEDDNGIPAGGSAAMSQELPASIEIDTTLAPTHRPIIPPIPRTCGARFSNSGLLVSFFPTKEERSKAMLFAPADGSKERPKGEPNFAGFGRLAANSPPARERYLHDEASATDDQSDGSDDSDDSSSSSSSDSELTHMHKINLWYQPGQRFKKTWSTNDSLRSSGGGTGVGTGTGTGISSKRRLGRPRNVISIYDLRAELPSQRQFAQEYAIFGDGAKVCEQNAKVAEKYGYQDLVDIWRYSALLLRSDVPLQIHGEHTRNKPILVIAKDSVTRAREAHAANEDGDVRPLNPDRKTLAGKVKWGHHPLAREFVQDLFDYFEKLADVQMLAMLSCIFGESSAEDGVAYAESGLAQPETPLPMKAPSFSLQYFPTDAALWDLHGHGRSNASSAVNTPRTSHTPVLYSGSQNSEDGFWEGDPGSNSYSCGETPPMKFDQTKSLSTSPNNRAFARGNTAIVSTFTASLPRALAGVSTSSSPPNPPSRKRPSPAETILSNFAPGNITWGGSSVFGQPADTGTARTSISDDEYHRDEMVSLVPYSISVQQENLDMFDDDGWMMTPLIETSRNSMYAHYRYAYAEMLQMWGQSLARLEIMKFDVLKENKSHDAGAFGTDGTGDGSLHESLNDSNHSRSNSAANHLLGGKREQLQALLASGRGLDASGICLRHELQLDPLRYTQQDGRVGGAVGTCQRCHHVQSKLLCVYCREPVDAIYPPCLGCGCASHEACLAEWHAMGETLCPAGDECNCVEEASNGRVESEAAIKAAIDKMRAAEGRGASTVGRGVSGRSRRQSFPSSLRYIAGGTDYDALEEDEDDEQVRTPASRSSFARGGAEDDGDDAREDWESVGSSQHIPSAGSGGRPSPYGNNPLSAARVSLGMHRLKKSAGEWGRPGMVRKESGNVQSWKKPGT